MIDARTGERPLHSRAAMLLVIPEQVTGAASQVQAHAETREPVGSTWT